MRKRDRRRAGRASGGRTRRRLAPVPRPARAGGFQLPEHRAPVWPRLTSRTNPRRHRRIPGDVGTESSRPANRERHPAPPPRFARKIADRSSGCPRRSASRRGSRRPTAEEVQRGVTLATAAETACGRWLVTQAAIVVIDRSPFESRASTARTRRRGRAVWSSQTRIRRDDGHPPLEEIGYVLDAVLLRPGERMSRAIRHSRWEQPGNARRYSASCCPHR